MFSGTMVGLPGMYFHVARAATGEVVAGADAQPTNARAGLVKVTDDCATAGGEEEKRRCERVAKPSPPTFRYLRGKGAITGHSVFDGDAGAHSPGARVPAFAGDVDHELQKACHRDAIICRTAR
jgi:hypothetical protein